MSEFREERQEARSFRAVKKRWTLFVAEAPVGGGSFAWRRVSMLSMVAPWESCVLMRLDLDPVSSGASRHGRSDA